MGDKWDVIVLGSGEAGKYLGWTLASQGKKVAVIERKWIGGSCPNVACLPSKNFVHSAHVAHLATEASRSGLLNNTAPGVHMAAVQQRKRLMVDGLIDMHEGRFQQSGAELIFGTGRFVGQKTIEVETKEGKRILTADTSIISTGSSTRIDDTPGLRESKPLTHVEILDLTETPRHLIILGAGYIGLEFAQIMRRLGSEVTVIDRNDRILKREDRDVSGALTGILTKEGVVFHTPASIDSVKGTSGSDVTVRVLKEGEYFEVRGSHILCATGRIPNTRSIGLEEVGIMLDAHGHVSVDEHLQTGTPGIFAVGDCAGSPHFTHVAFDDFRVVRDQLAGQPGSIAGRQVPYVLFTSPELAHIGAHEDDLKIRNIQYRKAQLPMAAFLRTRTIGDTTGFAKALVSAENDTILGFTALGANAGELLPSIQLAMKAGLPYTAIRDLVITHPTMSEGLVYLFMAVPDRKQTP